MNNYEFLLNSQATTVRLPPPRLECEANVGIGGDYAAFINHRSLPRPPLIQEALYLMRWTLDGVEFYRYVPKEEPAARSFNDVSGVIVDVIYNHLLIMILIV